MRIRWRHLRSGGFGLLRRCKGEFGWRGDGTTLTLNVSFGSCTSLEGHRYKWLSSMGSRLDYRSDIIAAVRQSARHSARHHWPTLCSVRKGYNLRERQSSWSCPQHRKARNDRNTSNNVRRAIYKALS